MQFFKLTVIAIAPAVMATDFSSLISEGQASLSSAIQSLGGTSAALSSAESAISSITANPAVASVISSLSANPAAISSFESAYTSKYGTTGLPEINSLLSSEGINPSETGSSGSGSGGGNAGSAVAPSYTLAMMGAAAAGIFGLAIAL